MKLVRKARDRVSFDSLAQLFPDIKIVCSDGDFLWNRSLLAASSPFLRDVLSVDESFIILNSFTIKTVQKCFSSLCGNKYMGLLENDESLMDILLFHAVNRILNVKEDLDAQENTHQFALKEEGNSDSNNDWDNIDESDLDFYPGIEIEEKNVRKRKTVKKKINSPSNTKESINSQCFFKDPSPDRFVNGVKTDVYFLSPETATSGPPYTCISCEYGSVSKRNVKVHFRRKHNKEKLYRCRNCDRKFYNSSEVVDHWKRIHGKSEDFLKCVCDICGKMFPRPGELKVHELLHSGIEYPCRFCGKTFKSPEYLNGHEKLHTTERVACKTCGKTFTSQKGAENHEERIHSNKVIRIPCDLCGKILKSKDNLKLHIQLIHTEVERKFSCDYCELFFRVPSQLKRHIQTVHEKSTQFSCPYCGQVLSSKTKFKRHSQRKHGGAELPAETDRSLCQPNALQKIKFCEPSKLKQETWSGGIGMNESGMM